LHAASESADSTLLAQMCEFAFHLALGFSLFEGLLHLAPDKQFGLHQGRVNTEHKVAVAIKLYRGADKSLARPGMKQATATEDFEFHISYL